MSEQKTEKKSAPCREKIEVKREVLEAIFEEGKPEGEDAGKWRQKLRDREEKLRYLQTGERYWYGKEWFGSEKRKTPA